MSHTCAACAKWAPARAARERLRAADSAAPFHARKNANLHPEGSYLAARSRAAPPQRTAIVAAAAAAAEAAEAAAPQSKDLSQNDLLDLLGFTLIIDDIVNPLGESAMGLLGGGGPQALWGAQLQRGQRARVALAAGVGADLPPSCEAQLQLFGIDTGALVRHQGSRTPRAWQILEEDGRRHEIWRTPFTPQLVRMLRPPLQDIPPAYRLAKAFHVGVHPQGPSLELLAELRAAAAGVGGLVSAETFAAADAAVPPAALQAFMRLLDVFSPNESEAASMLFGPEGGGAVPEAARREPRRLTEPFLEAGAPLVLLRRGPLGVVVQAAAGGGAWLLPAFPDTRAVDPTGCGNAACGAFVAALGAGEEAAAAAAWACAAGSLVAECSGSPQVAPSALADEAARRQAAVLAGAARLV